MSATPIGGAVDLDLLKDSRDSHKLDPNDTSDIEIRYVVPPLHKKGTLEKDGKFHYTPDPKYTGDVRIYFLACHRVHGRLHIGKVTVNLK